MMSIPKYGSTGKLRGSSEEATFKNEKKSLQSQAQVEACMDRVHIQLEVSSISCATSHF